jgi:hypothetical protein
MTTKARIELDAAGKTFASGLLPALIAALRDSRPGELLAVTSHDAGIGPALEAWCRFTRNALIETTAEAGRMRWVFRYGEAPAEVDLVPSPGRPSMALHQFSTAICAVTIVACAPPRRPRGGRWGSSVSGRSQAKRPGLASVKFS